MNSMRLLEFFAQHQELGETMVLASVVNTGGSTYSKAGEIMLISADGDHCGMLSGGCLEGDLVEHAKRVMTEDRAEEVSYDLNQDDELWGLGIGCDGTMDIYLQPLKPDDRYTPFDSVVTVLTGSEAASIELSREHSILLTPPPALLVLGAGADSEPLVNMALELGWRCTVVDHRPAYLANRAYGDNAVRHCMESESLSKNVSLENVDMAIVMSHHLASDRAYLSQLASTEIQYIGLLGPPKRRDRLLQEIGANAAQLAGRLRAPAGMQLGGRGAGAIAVEIVAEMQAYVAGSTLALPRVESIS